MDAKQTMEKLRELKACPESLAWAKGKAIAGIWYECHRGSWLLWIEGKMWNFTEAQKAQYLAQASSIDAEYLVRMAENHAGFKSRRALIDAKFHRPINADVRYDRQRSPLHSEYMDKILSTNAEFEQRRAYLIRKIVPNPFAEKGN